MRHGIERAAGAVAGSGTAAERCRVKRRLLLWLVGLLLLLWFLAATIWATLPHGVVVIGAGPKGGTYAQHAAAYAKRLERMGVKTRIEHLGDSLRIIDGVNGPCPCLDVGFTAQKVDAERYPEVVSAGAVELQPLFLFVRSSLGPMDTLAGLAGRRVVMPKEHSASAEAGRALLAEYGVTTAPPRYMEIDAAKEALRRGEADAGFFMLSPSNDIIDELARDESLTLFSFEHNVALSRRIGYLQAATMPRGAFDPARDRPARDVRLVAASVNVVVRRDIHPMILYALLGAMNEVHRGQSLVSERGSFPNMLRTALPVHEKAEAWSKNGTPWLYEKLPPLVASPLDEYWGMALFIVAVSSVLGTLGTVLGFFRDLARTMRTIAQGAARLLLRRLDARPRLGVLGRGLLRLADHVLPEGDAATQEQLVRLRARAAPR